MNKGSFPNGEMPALGDVPSRRCVYTDCSADASLNLLSIVAKNRKHGGERGIRMLPPRTFTRIYTKGVRRPTDVTRIQTARGRGVCNAGMGGLVQRAAATGTDRGRAAGGV